VIHHVESRALVEKAELRHLTSIWYMGKHAHDLDEFNAGQESLDE